MNQESYALITGASQGIGMEISKELARREHKLIMIAYFVTELFIEADMIKKIIFCVICI